MIFFLQFLKAGDLYLKNNMLAWADNLLNEARKKKHSCVLTHQPNVFNQPVMCHACMEGKGIIVRTKTFWQRLFNS